jgi:hypothetical protein
VLTPHRLPVRALDVTRSWQEGLDGYVSTEGTGPAEAELIGPESYCKGRSSPSS